ncbi:hypothetical protein ACQ4M4_24065 [Leptolyngbya sp. AN02str]|uniref:hypothetical protein n=1 Tax=Leptolyngbya sp. AN02str TaxID=3423363 RepID=UPI003D320C5D
MAGFFGFLGKKNDQAAPTAKGEKVRAYFLDADDAKTYGNIDYMRTAKAVRRTFPKTIGNGGEFEQTVQVSSMGVVKPGTPSMNGSAPSAPTFINSTTSQPSAPATQSQDQTAERRRTDTSMDMFRNMAKDIRKR